MAVKSRQQPPQFGGPERQAVTNEIHEAMLAAEVAPVLSHIYMCDLFTGFLLKTSMIFLGCRGT